LYGNFYYWAFSGILGGICSFVTSIVPASKHSLGWKLNSTLLLLSFPAAPLAAFVSMHAASLIIKQRPFNFE
jgi:hypothetical protein